MTIREIVTTSLKGNEFIAASCARCFRHFKPAFHIRYDNPTEEQVNKVWFKANKHDRKGTHSIDQRRKNTKVD